MIENLLLGRVSPNRRGVRGRCTGQAPAATDQQWSDGCPGIDTLPAPSVGVVSQVTREPGAGMEAHRGLISKVGVPTRSAAVRIDIGPRLFLLSVNPVERESLLYPAARGPAENGPPPFDHNGVLATERSKLAVAAVRRHWGCALRNEETLVLTKGSLLLWRGAASATLQTCKSSPKGQGPISFDHDGWLDEGVGPELMPVFSSRRE